MEALDAYEATTKDELKKLEATTKDELKKLEATTKDEIKKLEAATNVELKKLEIGLKELEARLKEWVMLYVKEQLAELKADMLKWYLAGLMAQSSLIIAVLRYLPH